jgi:hypothetical protein
MDKELQPFIVSADAINNIKSQKCKIVKTITFAPKSFGSYNNHPQGAIQYLAKITDMDLLCSSAWICSFSQVLDNSLRMVLV